MMATAVTVGVIWTMPVLARDRVSPARKGPAPAEVSIPRTRRIAFTSKINGHPYAIQIAFPSAPAPAGGYGVLYVLDGDAYFASATEATRANGNAPDVVVVGIGYPPTATFVRQVRNRRGPPAAWLAHTPPFPAAVEMERVFDLTLPATAQQLAKQTSAGDTPPKVTDVGGMDDYLKIIETEVKPRVEARIKINKAKQVLFGHSLGGLTVVRALFSEPTAFQTYIAASPSIWWDDKAVLGGEPDFDAKVASGVIQPRVLITVGSDEPTEFKMVENACALAARLKTLKGSGPFVAGECDVFPGQTHGLAPWPALGRAISFAFPDEQ